MVSVAAFCFFFSGLLIDRNEMLDSGYGREDYVNIM